MGNFTRSRTSYRGRQGKENTVADFTNLTKEQEEQEYAKWKAKQIKKHTEAPAKRTAVKAIIAAHQAEFDSLKAAAEAKAPALTPEKIEEKVQKYRDSLTKKTGKTFAKRTATKAILKKYEGDFKEMKENNLNNIRAGAKGNAKKGGK